MANGVSNIGFGTPAVVAPAMAVAASGGGSSQPVGAVPPAAPVTAVVSGGSSGPPAGETLPVASAAVAEPQLVQLQAAVDGVNKFLRDNQRQMLFQVDMKSGQTRVTIVNPATGEVIRQIPSAEVLSTASNLQQAGLPMTGLFFDERA
jgi:flagellar protein FlaG